MKWFDFLALGIMLLVVILQTIRSSKGMGLILLEAIGLIGCAKLSIFGYEGISRAVSISKPLALGGIFVISGIIWIIIASILHGFTQWSWGYFDPFFGFLFGVVCAWAVAYIVMRIIFLIYGFDASGTDSPVAKEILNFRTIHALFNLLNRAKLGPEDITPEKLLDTMPGK